MSENIWKRSQTKLFINDGDTASPEWVRIGKSVVFDMSMNAQTESFDFIQDDSPTEILDYYKPQLPIEHIAAEGDAGFDLLWDMFEKLSVGADAIKECLIVFPKTADSGFRAWKFDATVVFTNLTTTERKLKAELYIGGTIEHGKVTISGQTPSFTAD